MATTVDVLTFNDAVSGDAVVMFHSPNCGYCTKFKPVFAEVATEFATHYPESGLRFLTFDHLAHGHELGAVLKKPIDKYPTVLMFHTTASGTTVREYMGEHTRVELTAAVDEIYEPPALDGGGRARAAAGSYPHPGSYDHFMAAMAAMEWTPTLHVQNTSITMSLQQGDRTLTSPNLVQGPWEQAELQFVIPPTAGTLCDIVTSQGFYRHA